MGVGEERLEVPFVGVADNDFVGVNGAEPVHLDQLFLRQLEKGCQQVGVRRNIQDGLHKTTVGHVELAVQPEGFARNRQPVPLKPGRIYAANKQGGVCGI